MATLLMMRYVAWVQYLVFGENGVFDIDKKFGSPPPNPEDDNEAYFSDSQSTESAQSPPQSPAPTPTLPSTDPTPRAPVKTRNKGPPVGPNPIPTATEVAMRAKERARAVTTAVFAAGAASFGYRRTVRRDNITSPGFKPQPPPSALSYAAMTSSSRNIKSSKRNGNHQAADSLQMNAKARQGSLGGISDISGGSQVSSRKGSLASLIGGGDTGYVSMRMGSDDERESSVASYATDSSIGSLAEQFIDESYSSTPVHIGYMQYAKWKELYSEDFAGSPADIFEEAFSDDFVRSIHDERESKELVIGEWEQDEDEMVISNQPTTWTRKLEFVSNIKNAPSFLGITSTKVREVQRFRFYGSAKLVFDVAVSTPNVKLLAHVQTLQRNTFVQDENDPNRCHMVSTIAFKWPKKSMLKKFVQSQSSAEAKRSMQMWGAKMHGRLVILQRQKKRESLSTNSTTST